MKLKGAWYGLAYRELKFDTRLNVTTSNVHKSALLSQCTCHIQRIGLLCLSSDLSFFISFMSWLFWSTLCNLCILSCLLDYNRFNILFVFANNGRFCEYWVAIDHARLFKTANFESYFEVISHIESTNCEASCIGFQVQ